MDRAVDGLPPRLPVQAWALTFGLAIPTFLLLFSVIHPYADTRACIGHLPDPAYQIVPHNPAWSVVSRNLFLVVMATAGGAVVLQALRGQHRPALRWLLALTLMELQRCFTISLIPLCRAGVVAGGPAITSVPELDLGLFSIPWHPAANNDLIFSGHVGAVLLLLWATKGWPRPLRLVIWLFQGFQVYALLATREHYTVDFILALPCAYLADLAAVTLLGWAARSFPLRRG